MTTTTRTWVSRMAMIGLTVGGLSGAAVAASAQEGTLSERAPAWTAPETTAPELTAAQAEAKAAYYQARAEGFRALGGAGYKSGFVRTAEEQASHYAAQAARLRAVPIAPAPEAAYYHAVANGYARIGGAAYKAGLVQAAEAEARKYEPVAVVLPPDTALTRHLRFGKEIEGFMNAR